MLLCPHLLPGDAHVHCPLPDVHRRCETTLLRAPGFLRTSCRQGGPSPLVLHVESDSRSERVSASPAIVCSGHQSSPATKTRHLPCTSRHVRHVTVALCCFTRRRTCGPMVKCARRPSPPKPLNGTSSPSPS
eukprot:754652-Hanusia_phi.AAC.5